ncbi:hypothetical protein K3495_g9867 [Podosphaera aphanis]|nr:hypothetical protein K3495_g9867 [Podosphaera aphanis]
MEAEDTKEKSTVKNMNELPTQICENELVLRWLAQIEKDTETETTTKQSFGSLSQIRKICQSMEEKIYQLSPLNLEKSVPEVFQRRRRKSSSDISLIGELFNPNLKTEVKDSGLKFSTRKKEGQPRKRSSEASAQISEFSSVSMSQQHNSFIKRARHKTREDRYDVNRKYQPETKISTKKTKKRIDPKREKKKNGTRKANRDSTRNFDKKFNNLSSKEIRQDRLTVIRPSNGLGLFNNGRASSPAKRRRVPDLTFSEMDFLQNSKRELHLQSKKCIECNSGDPQYGRGRKNHDEISSFFKPKIKSLREAGLRRRSQSVPLHIDYDQNNLNDRNKKDACDEMEFSKSKSIENNPLEFKKVLSSCPSPDSTNTRQNRETAIDISRELSSSISSPNVQSKLEPPLNEKERHVFATVVDSKIKSKHAEIDPVSQDKIRHFTEALAKQTSQKIIQTIPILSDKNSSHSENYDHNLNIEDETIKGIETSHIARIDSKTEDDSNFDKLAVNEKKHTFEQFYSGVQLNSEPKSCVGLSSNNTYGNFVKAYEPISITAGYDDIAETSSNVEHPNKAMPHVMLTPSPKLSQTGESESQSYSDIDRTIFQPSEPTYRCFEQKSYKYEADKGFERTVGFQNANQTEANSEIRPDCRKTRTTIEEKSARVEIDSANSLQNQTPVDWKKPNFITLRDFEFMPLESTVDKEFPVQKPWIDKPFKSARLETEFEKEAYKADGCFLSMVPSSRDPHLFDASYKDQPTNEYTNGFLGDQLPFHRNKYQSTTSQGVMQAFGSHHNSVAGTNLSTTLVQSDIINDDIIHTDKSPFEDILDEYELVDDHMDKSDIETDISHQDYPMIDPYQGQYHSSHINSFDSNLIQITNSVEDLSTLSNFWSTHRQY